MHSKEASSHFDMQAHGFETLIYAAYYAPRGRRRLYIIGSELSRRYLQPEDLIVGIIGAEGSGKSTLVRGLFPGLELTNDDDGVNVRSAPIYSFSPKDFFAPHTFHIDVRYEMAFRQNFEIAEAINNALRHGRRVVIEHFDLIYKTLGYNAQIIFGVGEEIIVARPSVFGPFPGGIKSVVDRTIEYRLMAHSAEDITSFILKRDYNHKPSTVHSDVKHGFVINFSRKPRIDLVEVEAKVKDIISQDLPIQACGEDHIRIGKDSISCTGTRTHVKSSGKIKNFRLLHEFKYHPIFKEYLLVGMVGGKETVNIEEITGVVD